MAFRDYTKKAFRPNEIMGREGWDKDNCKDFLKKSDEKKTEIAKYQFLHYYTPKQGVPNSTYLKPRIQKYCEDEVAKATGPSAKATGASVTGASAKATGASEEATRSLAEIINNAFYGPLDKTIDITVYTLKPLNDLVNARINYNLDFPNDENCIRLVEELKKQVQKMIDLFFDFKDKLAFNDSEFNKEIINDLINAANDTMEYIRTRGGLGGCHINKGATDFLKYWYKFLGDTQKKYEVEEKKYWENFFAEVDRSVANRPKGGKTKRHKKAGKRKTHKKRAKAKTHKRKAHNSKSKKLTRKH